MHAIVGLGNPGSGYESTRHNIGFAVVDALASLQRVKLRTERGEYRIASTVIRHVECLLVQPLVYMNNSGEAVRDIMDRYDVTLDKLLIVVDDFNLPLGALRIRPRGSDGGHNGLYSIIYQLQSDAFARLRCGIAGETMPTDKKEMASFVLSPFAADEVPMVRQMVERATDAAVVAVTEGIETAIRRFNSKKLN